MTPTRNRCLDPAPIESLDQRRRGGNVLTRALEHGPEAIVELVDDAGLRGRGGAGFPVARKWRTVLQNRGSVPTTIVVNAAEGEPGSFKDRTLLLRNPYKVIEGALIAAVASGSDAVVIATKHSFALVLDRLRKAVDALLPDAEALGVSLGIVEGPDSYLFGEETALLEVVAGRPPFPRVAPPYRMGVEDIAEPGATADVSMAAPGSASDEPPVLVNNVESFAHVADIVEHGSAWFRDEGTASSPGTFLVTVTGDTRHHAVAEIPFGTTLADVIEHVGGGMPGTPMAVLSGVSHPLVPAEHFDAPLTYDPPAGAVSLGAGALWVFDTSTDPVAIAAGVARFLAVESCGQCVPCKADGLALSEELDAIGGNERDAAAIDELERRSRRITEGAKCALAGQNEAIVTSVLEHFPANVRGHVEGRIDLTDPILVAPLSDIRGGRAIVDETHLAKQPDWSHDERWGGEYPVDRPDSAVGSPAATPRARS